MPPALGVDHGATAQAAAWVERSGNVGLGIPTPPSADTDGNFSLPLFGRTLAYQVHRRARVAYAALQGGSAAHDFHPLVRARVQQLVAVDFGGHAVYLVIVDLLAARIHVGYRIARTCRIAADTVDP